MSKDDFERLYKSGIEKSTKALSDKMTQEIKEKGGNKQNDSKCVASLWIGYPANIYIFVCCCKGYDFSKISPLQSQQVISINGTPIDISNNYVCPDCGQKHKFVRESSSMIKVIHL